MEPESERRLRELGASAPELSADLYQPIAHERATRAVRSLVVVLVVVVVLVLVGVQWFRPIPSPVFHPALSTFVRLPGSAPSLPWPTTGSAALAVVGGGSLGHVGSTQPVPIASVAKVLTAYVVLKDHPLAEGADGPAIAVTPDTVSAYQAGVASQQSEVTVAAGETLTELQVLQGLLVASGNDMATLLADWDAGSTSAFVAKMASAARALGLDDTHVTDPTGLDPGTVSTPTDLVRLGEAAMAIPVFAQVVSMPQVTLPLAGTIYNLDFLLGRDGFVGIKTGSDAAAGGCFLFDAQAVVGAKTVTLVGAVLGQETVMPSAAAVNEADALVRTAFAAARPFPLFSPGEGLGRITTAWGASVNVGVSSAPSVVGWPGLTVPITVEVGTLPPTIPDGAGVGLIGVESGSPHLLVVMRSEERLPGPSALWRLTRL